MAKDKHLKTTGSNYRYVANAFRVMDIAEPIRVVVKPNVSKLEIWEELMYSEYNDWFAIVKDELHIYGYYELDGNLEGNMNDKALTSVTPITPDLIVPYSTSLLEIIPMFMESYYYFVLDRNQISHIVTFNDLDKLPVKICIFSLLLELESNLINLILCSDISLDEYFQTLSDKKQEEIKQICIDKYGKYSSYGALLSTSFIDKKKIVSSDSILMNKMGFNSKTQFNKRFEPIQKVRNRVAHSNSILEYLKTPSELNKFIKDIQELNNIVVQAIS